MGRVVVLCDAHIPRRESPQGKAFLRFLTTIPEKGDTLILLGDIFEFLVGGQKGAVKEYEPYLRLLSDLSHLCNLVYLEGNHDFHLRSLLPPWKVGEYWTEWVGDRLFLFQHGDRIAGDLSYEIFRSFLRLPIVPPLLNLLPAKTTFHGGLLLAKMSRKREKALNPSYILRLKEKIRKTIPRGVHVLVTAHLHTSFTLPVDPSFTWISLPPFYREPGYLLITEEKFQWVPFPPS